MNAAVLDAGALIALERDDRAMWAFVKACAMRGIDLVVPSTVIAQVWRGTRRQATLSRVIDLCSIAAFDPLARQIGELCARTKTRDICDAHVALVASRHADVIYTGDPEDIARLLEACGGRAPAIVRC